MPKKLRQLDVEELSAKIESEGLDYYLTEYSGPDYWKGTRYEVLYKDFMKARNEFIEELIDDGVEGIG